MTDVQELVKALLALLDISVTSGSVTLNINESRLQSVKCETYARVPQNIDNPRQVRAKLDTVV